MLRQVRLLLQVIGSRHRGIFLGLGRRIFDLRRCHLGRRHGLTLQQFELNVERPQRQDVARIDEHRLLRLERIPVEQRPGGAADVQDNPLPLVEQDLCVLRRDARVWQFQIDALTLADEDGVLLEIQGPFGSVDVAAHAETYSHGLLGRSRWGESFASDSMTNRFGLASYLPTRKASDIDRYGMNTETAISNTTEPIRSTRIGSSSRPRFSSVLSTSSA